MQMYKGESWDQEGQKGNIMVCTLNLSPKALDCVYVYVYCFFHI